MEDYFNYTIERRSKDLERGEGEEVNKEINNNNNNENNENEVVDEENSQLQQQPEVEEEEVVEGEEMNRLSKKKKRVRIRASRSKIEIPPDFKVDDYGYIIMPDVWSAKTNDQGGALDPIGIAKRRKLNEEKSKKHDETTNTNFKINLFQLGPINEVQKALFDKCNQMLSHKSTETTIQSKVPNTFRKYRSEICRYLRFLGEKGFSEIEINGSLMTQCMDGMKKSGGNNGLVGKATLENYRAAMRLLQKIKSRYMAAVYNIIISDEIIGLSEASDMIKIVRREQAQRRVNQCEDKATAKVVTKPYDYEMLSKIIIEQYNKTGSPERKDQTDAINTILELLLGHHLLIRGDNKRGMELSDMDFEIHKTKKGKTPILTAGVVKEKTMHGVDGARKAGAARNEHVEVCLVTIFALSLYYRFDVQDDKYKLLGKKNPIDFTKKENWYRYKVMFSTSSGDVNTISYNYEHSLSSQAFLSENFFPIKSTHLGRANQPMAAEAADISIDEISKAGHWTNAALDVSYLKGLPYKFIHFSANFDDDETYFLPRDTLKPSKRLLSKIFPWLEKERAKFHAYHESREDVKRGETDFAGAYFFDTLESFREVILQDLACLNKLAPNSIFAKQDIVKDPEFVKFAEEMEDLDKGKALSNSWITKDDALEYVIPAYGRMGDQLQDCMNNNTTNILVELQSLKAQIATLTENVAILQQSINRDQISSEKLTEFFSKYVKPPKKLKKKSRKRNYNEYQNSQMIPQPMTLPVPMYHPVMSAPPYMVPTKVPTEVSQESSMSEGEENTDSNSDAILEVAEMSQSTKSVADLFEEWYIGSPFSKSVQLKDLEGSKWRKNIKSQYFKKKKIITFISKIKAKERFSHLERREIALYIDEYCKSVSLKYYLLVQNFHQYREDITDYLAARLPSPYPVSSESN
ncbi:hypothetical protein CLIB1444_02S07800 [[Candida] jaroonii]|uniref:Uncharacterized protein n=1 Tax=[Candida] jaroonii TaxID=467808 RepID=A0ACA9Y365_9ASCO|nr:hypothetical protein CLIB1444_02S07800 [[Candida] jaroonii]